MSKAYSKSLTTEQENANEKFFDAVHSRLNDGGIWKGDDASMWKQKEFWYATLPNYNYIKKIVSSKWMKKVVLMLDATGTLTERELFKVAVANFS